MFSLFIRNIFLKKIRFYENNYQWDQLNGISRNIRERNLEFQFLSNNAKKQYNFTVQLPDQRNNYVARFHFKLIILISHFCYLFFLRQKKTFSKKGKFFFFTEQQPLVSQGLLIKRLYDHIPTHQTRQNSSGRGNSPKQVSDNTQQPQQTNIHAPCGNRTCKRSKRAVEDSQLTPRDHWERYIQKILSPISQIKFCV